MEERHAQTSPGDCTQRAAEAAGASPCSRPYEGSATADPTVVLVRHTCPGFYKSQCESALGVFMAQEGALSWIEANVPLRFQCGRKISKLDAADDQMFALQVGLYLSFEKVPFGALSCAAPVPKISQMGAYLLAAVEDLANANGVSAVVGAFIPGEVFAVCRAPPRASLGGALHRGIGVIRGASAPELSYQPIKCGYDLGEMRGEVRKDGHCLKWEIDETTWAQQATLDGEKAEMLVCKAWH